MRITLSLEFGDFWMAVKATWARLDHSRAQALSEPSAVADGLISPARDPSATADGSDKAC